MTETTCNLLSRSYKDTYQLGEKIGIFLSCGVIITLTGEVGTGKTSFVKGLASGLEVPKNYYITSPTFTIINEYPGRLFLCHADLYRISSMDEFEEIGLYEKFNKDCVIAIEWADRLNQKHLIKDFSIHFEFIDDNSRRIQIIPYGHKAINLLSKINVTTQID